MSTSTRSQDVRVHTQPSNRANAALAKGKSKAADDRRVVYKSVLENPYQIKPPTPLNVQNSLLACLADLLPEVAEYHVSRETASRKRKSGARAGLHGAKKLAREQLQDTKSQTTTSKKRRLEDDTNSDIKRAKIDSAVPGKQASNQPTSAMQESPTPATATLSSDRDIPSSLELESEPAPKSASVTAPDIVKHCTFGINEVTKRLEAQANSEAPGDADLSLPKPRLRFVIACRSDVDPPLIIEHLPILVAACNSSLPVGSDERMFVKLATLPMGGEHMLAEIVGLRRIAVMALDAETPGLDRLESLLSSLTTLQASWLARPSGSEGPKDLVPTHIKQLKTTAPKDMKAAREKRKREVGEAKEAAKAEGTSGQRKRRKVQSQAKVVEHGKVTD